MFFFFTAKEKTPIKITLRDGKVVDGLAWKTTPYEIAASIRYGCEFFQLWSFLTGSHEECKNNDL